MIKVVSDAALKLRPYHKRRAIESFLKSGSHSARGTLLPSIINHCEANDIGYRLDAMPGAGYHVALRDHLAPLKPRYHSRDVFLVRYSNGTIKRVCGSLEAANKAKNSAGKMARLFVDVWRVEFEEKG